MINWFTHLYPYTNVHELNLDWILGMVRANEAEVKNFIGANVIKYANPIAWDISRQYEANTVVVDPGTGDAYISVKPVPFGYDLTHIDYWTKIFNYGATVDTLMAQIASNEGNSPRATQDYSTGDLMFINDILYWAITPINNGDSFVPNTNIETVTVEDVIKHNLGRSDIGLGDVLFIGDSYNDHNVVTPTWADAAKLYLGLDNNHFQSFGYGARGFANAYPFINDVTNDLPNIQRKTKITHVVVCAGANDVGQTETDIKTAISNFKTFCKTNFPNATLYIGFISWSRLANVNWLYTYNYYKTACELFGIPFLYGAEIPMHNIANLNSAPGDEHHPIASGSYAIAQAVSGALVSGSTNTTFIGGVQIVQSGTFYVPGVWVNVVLDRANLMLNKLDIPFANTGGDVTGNTPLPLNTQVEIGSFNADTYIGRCADSITQIATPVQLYINDTGKGYPAMLTMTGGKVYIMNLGDEAITGNVSGHIYGFNYSKSVLENY